MLVHQDQSGLLNYWRHTIDVQIPAIEINRVQLQEPPQFWRISTGAVVVEARYRVVFAPSEEETALRHCRDGLHDSGLNYRHCAPGVVTVFPDEHPGTVIQPNDAAQGILMVVGCHAGGSVDAGQRTFDARLVNKAGRSLHSELVGGECGIAPVSENAYPRPTRWFVGKCGRRLDECKQPD